MDSTVTQDYYLAYLCGYKDKLRGLSTKECPFDDEEMIHLEGWYDGYDDGNVPIPDVPIGDQFEVEE